MDTSAFYITLVRPLISPRSTPCANESVLPGVCQACGWARHITALKQDIEWHIDAHLGGCRKQAHIDRANQPGGPESLPKCACPQHYSRRTRDEMHAYPLPLPLGHQAIPRFPSAPFPFPFRTYHCSLSESKRICVDLDELQEII